MLNLGSKAGMSGFIIISHVEVYIYCGISAFKFSSVKIWESVPPRRSSSKGGWQYPLDNSISVSSIYPLNRAIQALNIWG